MHTILVCDTEPVAIEGVRGLLEAVDSLRVVASETSLLAGMDTARALEPSILLVDKTFGTHALMEWLQGLRRANARTAMVVWGSVVSEAEALRFLQAGAAGVLRKTASLQELMQCLKSAAEGGNWMQHEMLSEPERTVRGNHSPLTARELQVMELVERGLKNKDIGAALGIQTGTVKIHLKHIFEKTGIRGRFGLALSGLREKGLLAPLAMDLYAEPSQ